MRKNLMKSAFSFLGIVIFAGLIILILAVACSDDNPVAPDLPEILLSPPAISMSSTVGEGNSNHTLVKVFSNPFSNINFSFSCDADWIALSNLAGTNSGITLDSFSILYHVSDLPVGNYVDSVVVTSSEASNSPVYLPITYTIVPRDRLLVAWPRDFYNYVTLSSDPVAPDTFTVTSADYGAYNYTLTKTADWLLLSNSSGTTPDTVVINVDVDATIWGGHVDTVWVTAADLINSPQPVVCSLYIHPWQPQNALFLNNILYDVQFVDNLNGWAVGLIMSTEADDWSGYVVATSDGGEHWTTDTLIMAENGGKCGLSALDIVDNNMWIVGQSGIIKYSPDLGETWLAQSTGLPDTNVDLYDIKFVSDQTGWIVGASGTILATDNGGITWVNQTSNTAALLWGCCFIDQSTGWIVGDQNVLLRTTNGGQSWSKVTVPTGHFKDVFFVDATHGWVVGDAGIILHTADGGTTWLQQFGNTDVDLTSVFFVNSSLGWITGNTGTVLNTIDGGVTWANQQVYPESYADERNDLNQVFFISDLNGWVVGRKGEIRHTNCGGK